MARVDAFQESGLPQAGIKMGFPMLDWKTTGFYPGDLVVLGARPAMGKSALGIQMLANVARDVMRSGESGAGLMFSMEMSKEQITERIASLYTDATAMKIRRGTPLSDREYEGIADACEAMYNLPIIIDDSGGLTPMQLLAKARKVKQECGLSFIVVDYLQLMASGKKSSNRTGEIDDISRDLKLAAKTLGVPILALCQLSRAVEQRENRRPTMADLRESGSLEANADTVLLLYRESYYKAKQAGDQERPIEEAELIIGKQRAGETGTVLMSFEAARTRFIERDRR
jgi:replicative DNA helicase